MTREWSVKNSLRKWKWTISLHALRDGKLDFSGVWRILRGEGRLRGKGHKLYFKMLSGTSLVCEFFKLYIINCSGIFLKALTTQQIECFEICLKFWKDFKEWLHYISYYFSCLSNKIHWYIFQLSLVFIVFLHFLRFSYTFKVFFN